MKPYARTAWTLAGGLLLAMVALLIVALGAQAATMTLSGPEDGYIAQGDGVQITVQGSGTEVFTSGDRVLVTTPFACTYGVVMSAGTSVTVTYPDDFTKLAGGSECFDEANTWASASQDKDTYTVSFDPGDTSSVAVPPNEHFRARFTDAISYERTQRVTVQAYGYNDRAVLDAVRPDGRKYSPQPLESAADANGMVEFHLDLGPGDAENGDLGIWTMKVIDISSSGITKKEDRGRVEVVPTSVVALWSVQPGISEADAVVQRMASTNARLDLVYAGSIGHPDGERKVTFAEVDSGELDLLVTTGSSQFSASASFNQNLQEWQVNYQVGKTDPVSDDYQLSLDVSEDAYGNPVVSSPSRTFAVEAAEVTPEGTVTSAVAERASADKSLTGRVELRFPSGAAVTKEDVGGDGDLPLHLFRNGIQVTQTPLLGKYDSDGLWAIDARLPKDMPLGTAELRLTGPVVLNAGIAGVAPNRVLVPAVLGEFEVEAGEPSTGMRILDDADQPAATFLRGGTMRVEVDFMYGDGSPVTSDDVFGGTGRGRAFLRVMPNGEPDNTFHVDLQYAPGVRSWFVDYVIPGSDPVGNWQVSAVMSDQWGNQAFASRDVRVGMDVDLTLSSATVLRSEDLQVSVLLSAPGDDTPLTGSVQLNVTGPGGTILDGPMTFSGQDYQATISVPSDAVLGTYLVTVHAQLAEDDGFAQGTFEVIPASIAAIDKTLTDTSTERLGDIGFTFRLQYPNGQPVPGDGASPVVRAVRTDGTFEQTLASTYVESAGSWSAVFTPGLSAPLGDYRFSVGGTDDAGNHLEEQLSSEFTVGPADIRIDVIETMRLQYVRGDALRIVAEASYADGSVPSGITIPVAVMAGGEVQGEALLSFDPELARFAGEHVVPLDAPLSSSARPWFLRVDEGTVQDADGNLGPQFPATSNQFSVAPATVAVTILEEPTNALVRGADTVKVRFQLHAPDGTELSGGDHEGLRVLLVRGEQVIGNATVYFDTDAYVAELGLAKGMSAGEYILRISGVDGQGNTVQAQETNAFQVLASGTADKGSPAPGGVLAALGLAVAALARRR